MVFMSPLVKDIYTQKEPGAGRPEPERRRPFSIWWAITTPAEKVSFAFVLFAIFSLVGLLVGISVYQYRQLTAYRRVPQDGPAAARLSVWDGAAGLPMDPTGRLVLDEFDDAETAEPLPTDPVPAAELTPERIRQAAVSLRRAQRAEDEGDWAAALDEYQRVGRQFPDSLRIQELIGLTLLRLRDFERAAEVFGRLAEARPASAGVWNNLGVARMSLKQLSEAESAFERALEADPSHRRARRNLAVLRFRQGDMPRASATLAEILRADPNDEEAALMLAVSLARQNRWTEAAAVLDDISLRSPSAPVWFYLAEARSKTGQNAAAISAIDRAVAMVDRHVARQWLDRPELESLRSEPEFRALVDRLRLPAP